MRMLASAVRGFAFNVALAMAVVAVAATPLHTAGTENPFGLPAAQDAKHVGAVMLHGGGHGLADAMRREFVRLAGGKDARILLMPSDQTQRGKTEDGEPVAGGESAAQYERRLASPAEYGRWAALRDEKVIADFHFLYRDAESDPRDTRFYALLEKATGVWLPAYDQTWLPAQFAAGYPKELSRFQVALRNLVARGGVVGGLGGGMAALGETVITEDLPNNGGWTRAKLGFGLALFNGAIADQNFSSLAGRIERLSDLLRNGAPLDRRANTPGVERRTIGLGIERHTAAVLEGNTLRTVGPGRVHLFLKSNGDRTITWRTIAAGDEPVVIQSSTAKAKAANSLGVVATRSGDADAREPSGDGASANPFGLPKPNDPARPGTVVLHGGGSTGDMLNVFPTLTPVAKPLLVHCPTARESCQPSPQVSAKAFAAHLEETFDVWRDLEKTGSIERLEFITTNTAADANRAAFVAPLRGAHELWFCGGDQAHLARFYVDAAKPTLFQQEVLAILQRGGAVGGSSAGLAIQPDIMIEGGSPENGKPAEATLSRGLGTLKNVLAEQHFDARAGRIERLTALLHDHARLAKFVPACRPQQMIGLAVEEDTALIVQADRLRVTGKKLAHVFLQSPTANSITWHALKPGDAARVRIENNAPVLELEDWTAN